MKSSPRYVIRTADVDDPDDLVIVVALGEEMVKSSIYRSIGYRKTGKKEVVQRYRANKGNVCSFLAFRDGEAIGLLSGEISYMFAMDYILALCVAVYIKPDARDNKAVLLLLSTFREWAEKRGADEIRFLVTSGENAEKTHEMFQMLGCRHLGGNYAFPLSEKSSQVFPQSEEEKLAFPRAKKKSENS